MEKKSVSKTVSWLRGVYAVVLLLLPVYSVLYAVFSAQTRDIISSGQESFLVNTYFLVFLFVLFMLTLTTQYLPHTIGGMLNLIFIPVVLLGVQSLFTEQSVGLYFASLGMVYVISMMVAYIGLLFVGPFVTGKVKSLKDGLAWLALGVMQMVYIIPGIGAASIFGEVILKTQIWPAFPEAEPYSPMLVLSYALFLGTVLQNAWSYAKDMRKESVLS